MCSPGLGKWLRWVLTCIAGASFGRGAQMGPREQAYVQVGEGQLNAAAAQHRALDPVQAFGSAL